MLGMGSVEVVSSVVQPRMKTCRCLFGPVDHEELRETLRKEREEIRIQDQERWNFDFTRELPLAGRWEWEQINVLTATTPLTSLSGHSSVSVTSLKRKRRDSTDSHPQEDIKIKQSRVETVTSLVLSDISSQNTPGSQTNCDNNASYHKTSNNSHNVSSTSSNNEDVVSSTSSNPHQSLITDHFVVRKSRSSPPTPKHE